MSVAAEAIAQQVVWKNGEMLRFACALIRRALALPVEPGQFTTDIVPDSERGDGHGIAGSVVDILKKSSLLEPVGIVQRGPDNQPTFYAHRLKSTRADAKSRWLNVYRLTSRALAQEFLSRYEPLVPELETQAELLPA